MPGLPIMAQIRSATGTSSRLCPLGNGPPEHLDRASARRVALAAQGFADPGPTGRVDVRHFRRVVNRMGLLQLDSVQAVCRSHYLPVYSRLGCYDREYLDRWLWHSGEMFETWAHEASVIPVGLEPLLRWRKERTAQGETWSSLRSMGARRDGYVAGILAEVKSRGPLRSAELVDPRPRSGTWWGGRSDGRLALDWLFRTGQVGVRRDVRFERSYETFDGLIPAKTRTVASPFEEEAQRALLLTAARCHGVGAAADLADYFRIRPAEAHPRLEELVADGHLKRCTVEGWAVPAYRHPGVVVPKQMTGRALLSPFEEEAQRALLLTAARCHGVGAPADLADYYRIRPAEAHPRLEELVADGHLNRCTVEGWSVPAYRHPGVVVPKELTGSALLSPFDPVVWFRPRAERLFGFRYRVEIYVPAAKREFGYYVLPFLLGDRLGARVDLKADRAGDRLLARGVFVESGEDREEVAGELSSELDRLASFLDLDEVVVGRRGNLAAALRAVRA